jgi:hypothetical protein
MSLRTGSGNPRGYFGIGAEGMSKPMNLGALMRTAHAFGASFTFTVGAAAKLRDVYRADTSRSADHVAHYQWDTIAEVFWLAWRSPTTPSTCPGSIIRFRRPMFWGASADRSARRWWRAVSRW